MSSRKRMFAAAVGVLALVGLGAGTARAVVDADADVTPLAIPFTTITISIKGLLANDEGQNLKFVNIKKFGPQKASIGFIKRKGDLLFIHVNSFAVPDANGFVNLRYKIKGKGGTDTAFVRIPIGAISAT